MAADELSSARQGSRRAIRSRRRDRGVFYTPLPVAKYVVSRTLEPLLADRSPAEVRRLTVLDPACGDGVFLVAALQQLAQAPAMAPQGPLMAVDSVHGVDIDREAIRAARRALLEEISPSLAGKPPAALRRRIAENFCCGDALVGDDFAQRVADKFPQSAPPHPPVNWRRAFEEAFRRSPPGFDAVVGNPPYVNIRRLSRIAGPALKHYYEKRFRCARGGYDLYVLFIELALRLLRPGGRFGLIVPNKVAALDYARACREVLLTETTLEEITDLADAAPFREAGVYPYVLIGTKRRPAEGHLFRVAPAQLDPQYGELLSGVPLYVRQDALSAQTGFALHGVLEVEARVPTEPLSKRANLHSGTTGFLAQAVAGELREYDAGGNNGFHFVVSGNIDRYSIHLGNVRFMNRRWKMPVLPTDARLSPRKHQLFREPKIVLAGMTRRLEAAYDDMGLALGVQVFAVTRPLDDYRYLLGLLNSRLMSYLFQLRFRAKHLAGGFFAVNKSQLSQLPIRIIGEDSEDRRLHDRLVECVDELIRLYRFQAAAAASTVADLEAEVDRIVCQLYRVTEVERLCFAPPSDEQIRREASWDSIPRPAV